jgi:hypothetical protein
MQQINPVNYLPAGDPISGIDTSSLAAEGYEVISEGYVDRYLAVRFDATGAIVGVGDGAGGAMLGTSCLASAAPLILRG